MKQLEEWLKINRKVTRLRYLDRYNPRRQDLLDEVAESVNEYYLKYKTPFNPAIPPRRKNE